MRSLGAPSCSSCRSAVLKGTRSWCVSAWHQGQGKHMCNQRALQPKKGGCNMQRGALTRRRTDRTRESGGRTASSTEGTGMGRATACQRMTSFRRGGQENGAGGSTRLEEAGSDPFLTRLLPARAPLGRLRKHNKVSEQQERERGPAAYLQIIARANIEGGQGVAQPLAVPVAIHHLHLLFGRNRELPANALHAHGVR